MPKKKTRKVATRKAARAKRPSAPAKVDEAMDGREDLLQPGPRKLRQKGGKIRLTSHKARSRWFQS